MAQVETLAEAKEALKSSEDTTEETVEEIVEEVSETEETETVEEDEAKPVEAWQQTEEAEEPDNKTVSMFDHVKAKKKLRGKLSEKNDENERLKAENEALKKQTVQKSALKAPVPPNEDDFNSWEPERLAAAQNKYKADKATYDDAQLDARLDARENNRMARVKQEEAQAKVKAEVGEHYSRADELVKDDSNDIDEEKYRAADTRFRSLIRDALPKGMDGDIASDLIISKMGKGSAKLAYYVSINKNAGAMVQSKLLEDPNGLSLAVYLGQLDERINNPKKPTSTAPKPAADAQGDATPNVKEGALKKKYDKASDQAAYNIKKQARLAGFDVSKW